MQREADAPKGLAAHTLPAEDGAAEAERFIRCLVTPKIAFNLPNRGWSRVEDISQADLRTAFLARFPMQFDVERVVFTPALAKSQPDGSALPSRIVFKIGVRAGASADDAMLDDERVLLDIIKSLDKAYAQRHQQELESARAEMLSSTMSFETLAEEVRRAQATATKELQRLKDQQASSQKRLFMLELEKEQLQAARLSSESTSEALRLRVDALSAENAALRGEVGQLMDRVQTLTELVTTSAVGGGESLSGHATPAPALLAHAETHAHALRTADTMTQTPASVSSDDLVASMAKWLNEGCQILQRSTPSAANGSDAPEKHAHANGHELGEPLPPAAAPPGAGNSREIDASPATPTVEAAPAPGAPAGDPGVVDGR